MADIPTPHTIAIIGAGVAGPVLALTILSNPILKQRYRPVIYERLPCPVPTSTATTVLEGNGDGSGSDDPHTRATYAVGAAVALTSNALYPLYSLGLRPSLDAISCETRRIKIWRSWGGKGRCEHKYCNQIKNPNWQEDLDTNLRVVERAKLQRLVLDKVQELGGAMFWGKKLSDVQNLAGGEMKLCFEGGEEAVASLVVGADGGWSLVRRHIVSLSEDGKESKDKKVNQLDRWKPEFAHADGIYGVSKPIESSETINAGVRQRDIEEVEDGDTHWVLLDSGTASTWALPGGRQFWTISFPSEKPPRREHVTDEMRKPKPLKLYDADITLGGYTLEETEEVLRKYESAWHPVAGSFGELFRRSERIVRASLWYRAWEEHEIGGKNVVVMGDAARLMLPTSGQGSFPFHFLHDSIAPSLRSDTAVGLQLTDL